MSCAAVCCSSRTTKEGVKDPELSFHTFPIYPEIRNEWIKALRHQNWVPTKYSRLCSKHFEQSCFIPGLSIKKLKPGSVPTIFEGYPEYYQKKGTSGRKSRSKLQMPPEPAPVFPQPMIEEIKDEWDPDQPGEDPPSDETLSLCEDPGLDSSQEQSDEDQIIENLVHPVPISDEGDPLCEVKVEEENRPGEYDGPKEELDATEEHNGPEEESDGPEDEKNWIVEELEIDELDEEVGGTEEEKVGIGEEPSGTIKEENRMVEVKVPYLARRVPEQNIKNINSRCDQALQKVRDMHQMIRHQESRISSLERRLQLLSCFIRGQHGGAVLGELLGRDATNKQIYPDMIKQKDEMITQLQAEVESLRNGTTVTSEEQNGAVVLCGNNVPTIKIQSLNKEERIKKVNRQLLITKHNNRKKSSADRLILVQRTSKSRQNTSNILQKSLVGPTSEIPQEPLAGVKRKLVVQKNSVVPATSVIPLIGNKRTSDVRQNPSIVIHPKLDFRKITPASDIQPKLVGLQRPADIRQNALVIQIDGMHNTVLQPKLVRLDDKNIQIEKPNEIARRGQRNQQPNCVREFGKAKGFDAINGPITETEFTNNAIQMRIGSTLRHIVTS